MRWLQLGGHIGFRVGEDSLKITKEWEVFVKCVVGREHLPDWSRLWDDFTKEDIREGSHSSGQKEDKVEENVALAAEGKKKKEILGGT
jgi:hypothetical protein